MKKLLRGLSYLAVGAILILIGLRLTIMETWTVPEDEPWITASIAPTLAGGDEVVLLTWGERYFGDLVRCRDPDDRESFVIGRIVGVGNDVVEVEGPSLRVNNKRYTAQEACKEPQFSVLHPDTNSEIELQCSRIEIAGGWHFRGTAKRHRRRSNDKKLVGEGRVYLLSDNRDLHLDSRDFGTIPIDSCDATIVFRLWGRHGWSDVESRFEVVR